ncbi:MAG: hypothetical protein ACK55K_06030 [Bacteroidota bacterium]|jgi:hypothetical protein
MVNKKILLYILVIAVMGCSEKESRPGDALGTARTFIRSSLDGDYDQAKLLMLQDSINLYELDQLSDRYNKQLTREEKEGYKNASIIIHSVDQVNDSVVVINYSNSYKEKKMPVKVILKDGVWQVDLNYTFSGNL